MKTMTPEDLLEDFQAAHSMFQMDYFITLMAGGGTPYGQYQQALRELHSRHLNLKRLKYQRQLAAIDLCEAREHSGEDSRTDYDRARARLKAEQLIDDQEEMERQNAECQREHDHFLMQCRELHDHLVTHYGVDGKLTPEVREKLEHGKWAHQLKTMMAMDYHTRHQISPETLKMLCCVPDAVRASLLRIKPETLVAWIGETGGVEPIKELSCCGDK